MLKDVEPELKKHVESLLGFNLTDSNESYRDSVQLQVGIELLQVDQINKMFAAGLQPDLVAGHSLGVFAAAYAVKSVSQDDLFRIVADRAHLMQTAYPQDYGMGVVVGLTKKQLTEVVSKVYTDENPVYVSNQNSADQICLSGKLSAIDKANEIAKSRGAIIAKRLQVPVPSHSPLMNKVAKQLKKELQNVNIARPQGIYLTNYSGRAVRTAEPIRNDLTNNLIYPVYFEEMMNVAHDYQPNVIVNFSPGEPFRKILKQKFGDLRQANLNQMNVSDVVYLLHKWERGN